MGQVSPPKWTSHIIDSKLIEQLNLTQPNRTTLRNQSQEGVDDGGRQSPLTPIKRSWCLATPARPSALWRQLAVAGLSPLGLCFDALLGGSAW
jgi:hypothetical protein